jgi:linoleoyl-CoA desaturase
MTSRRHLQAMATAALQVRFPRDDGFRADLKGRAAAYFERTSKPPQGGLAMHLKTAAILAWFAASYGLLLAVGGASAGLAAGLTISLALATAGIGFSVMHDANHGAYSRSARVNRGVGFALDFIGASSYVWRFKHNVQHHTFANVPGLDADIDAEPFLRLSHAQRRRALHRFQAGYAWPLYGVLSLKWWLVDDAVDLVRGTIGGHPFPRPRGFELAAVVAGKAAFLGWAVLVPVLVYRSPWPVAWFVFGSLVLGVVMAVVFQLAHSVSDAQFHGAPGGDGRLPTGWAEHQVRSTVDFARSNRLLAWYLGGLNFQIEHHLFPGVCHVHYPALAPIVEETCRAHGIPYHAAPSLRAAIAGHHRHLRALGAAAPAQR